MGMPITGVPPVTGMMSRGNMLSCRGGGRTSCTLAGAALGEELSCSACGCTANSPNAYSKARISGVTAMAFLLERSQERREGSGNGCPSVNETECQLQLDRRVFGQPAAVSAFDLIT